MGIIINEQATILNGILKGVKGRVVGVDWNYKLVEIRVDDRCVVETDYDNIVQEEIEDGELMTVKQIIQEATERLLYDDDDYINKMYDNINGRIKE